MRPATSPEPAILKKETRHSEKFSQKKKHHSEKRNTLIKPPHNLYALSKITR
jgi:hypothetical protein